MDTRTKIICTIGPSTNSYNAIKELALAGMNVVRINMSHANHESAKKIISNANEKLKFIIVSGIFSEKHSDAIQIINF
mgnify:FL=1